MSSKQYTTEFVIKGDSSSGVKATRELQEANADMAREMQRAQRQSEETASSFESVSVHARRLATVSAAVTVAMGTMAVAQTRVVAEQAALARSVGVSVQTLQQWEFAAQSVNLGAGKMGDIFKDTSEKIGDFVSTGGGEAADLFERLNLDINTLMAMRPDQQLIAIGEALDGVATQGEKIFFMESLANDASRLLPLLENNAAALRDQISLADQLGVALPQSDVDSIERASQALNELTALGTAFANAVASEWAPGIIFVADVAKDLTQTLGGMGEVVDNVTDFTLLLSGTLAGRMVGALGAASVAAVKKAQADRAVAIQAGITAERETGAALATARRAEAERVAALNSAANAAQRAQAAQVEAASQLRSIQLTQQQIAAERVLETQRLQAQISATGRQQSLTRLAEIRRTEMALTTQSAAAQRALNAAEVQSAASARTLSAAKVDLARATTATTAATTANTAAVAANTTAQRTLTAVGRGAAGAMALVGGPLGVATLAATAFFLFRDSSDDVSSSLTDMNAPLESVIADFKELSVESQRAAMIKWGDRYQEEVEKARSALSKIREEVLSIGFEDASGAEARAFFDEVNAGFEAVESGAQSLDELLTGLQDQLGVPDSALRQIRLLAAEYSEGSITVEELGGLLQTLETAFNDVAQGAENSGQAVNNGAPSATTLDAWAKYNDRLRESIAATRDGGSAMGAANRALDGMGDGVNNVMRGYSIFLSVQDEALKDQRKAQQEATAESRRAAEEAERTAQRQAQAAQQSAEAQAKALVGVQQEMDPLLADHAEYVERLAVLDRALAEGTISEEAYGEAVRWSAEQYQRAATGAEEYEKQTAALVGKYDSHRQKAEQLTAAIAQINDLYRAGEIDGNQYTRMMGAVRDEMQQLALDADPAAQEMARAWEEASNRIDETFADAFRGAFDSFDDFTDQLLDGFKRLLAELAYQATLKPIVVQFTQQMGGALGIPGVGGQGRGAGGFNLGSIGSLKNGWDTVSGLWGAGSAASTAAAGYGAAGWAGSATGAYSGWAGSAAAGAAQAGGGLMGAASAAMPWVGGALLVDNVLGLGIADGIVKGISSLFGGGKTAPKFELATVGQDVDPGRRGLFENYGEGVYSRGALGTVGFYDPNTARLEETFDGFDNAKAFLDGITALDNAMVGAVANLDNGAEKTQAMASAAQAVRLNAGDAAGIANQLATRTLAVVDVLDGDFSASLRGMGLDAEQITGRVVQAANAMQLLDSNSARLNLQFDASAAGAMRAADGMAQLMGGADNLSTSLGGFYDAFYTEEEKLQHLTEDLSGTFASMGRELPTTREGVRELVEGLELMGAAGQEQLATILQTTPALREYITAMEAQNNVVNDSAAIAEERWRLENELLEAQGRDAELLARTRERELSSIDESNRALQERIWMFEDEKAAQDAAIAAQEAAQQRADLLNRTSLYSSGIVSGVDDALDAYNDQMTLASEIARQREQQLQEEMRAVQQLGGLLDSLLLSEQSILDPAARLQEAQRQFAELEVRAENGDTEAVAQLQGAAQAYLGEAAGYFGQASSQYASIFNDVTGSVESLEDSFGDSIAMLGSIEGIEQQMLREQQRARDSLNASLTQHVNQTNLLGSIADLLDMLPRGLASEIADILPEYSSGGGSGGSSGGSGGGFNSAAYLANKTAQVNRIGYEGRSNWTTSQVLDRIRAEWGSLEEHYNRVGKSEGVQPYATGAWQLARDQLAYVHEGEFIAPSREGIADEFRAYAAGDYQAELMAELGNIQRALPMANLPPMPMNMGSNQSASAPAINLEPLLRKIDALTQIVAQLRSERSSDAQKAANQRSEQVREQQKTNRNAKIRPTTKNGVGTV